MERETLCKERETTRVNNWRFSSGDSGKQHATAEWQGPTSARNGGLHNGTTARHRTVLANRNRVEDAYRSPVCNRDSQEGWTVVTNSRRLRQKEAVVGRHQSNLKVTDDHSGWREGDAGRRNRFAAVQGVDRARRFRNAWSNGTSPSGIAPTFADIVGNLARFPTVQVEKKEYGEKDGVPAIKFTAKETQEATKRFENSLIVKFQHRRPALSEVSNYLKAKWRIEGGITFSEIWDDRHVIVILDSKDDVNIILASPIRSVGQTMFRLFRWSPGMSPDVEDTRTTKWVRLPGLPIQLFDKNIINAIVSSFATFVDIDDRTKSLTGLKFARACVEVDVRKTIPNCVWIELSDNIGFFQNIILEGSLAYCVACRKHGHVSKDCRQVKMQRPVQQDQGSRNGDCRVNLAGVDRTGNKRMDEAVTIQSAAQREPEYLDIMLQSIEDGDHGRDRGYRAADAPSPLQFGAVEDQPRREGNGVIGVSAKFEIQDVGELNHSNLVEAQQKGEVSISNCQDIGWETVKSRNDKRRERRSAVLGCLMDSPLLADGTRQCKVYSRKEKKRPRSGGTTVKRSPPSRMDFRYRKIGSDVDHRGGVNVSPQAQELQPTKSQVEDRLKGKDSTMRRRETERRPRNIRKNRRKSSLRRSRSADTIARIEKVEEAAIESEKGEEDLNLQAFEDEEEVNPDIRVNALGLPWIGIGPDGPRYFLKEPGKGIEQEDGKDEGARHWREKKKLQLGLRPMSGENKDVAGRGEVLVQNKRGAHHVKDSKGGGCCDAKCSNDGVYVPESASASDGKHHLYIGLNV